MLDKLRAFVPERSPATKILLGIFIGMFVVMMIDATQNFRLEQPLSALTDPPLGLLWRWGAHASGDFAPWRVIMSVFLHGGIIHLGFNCYAMSVVAPATERHHGSAATFALFVLTGVGAALASNLFGAALVGFDAQDVPVGRIALGASGGLMGLIGVMAVAGHRIGTQQGFQVRNSMVTWAALTMLLGFVLNVDNIAHGVGFALGALLALLLPQRGLAMTRGAEGLRKGVVAAFLLSLALIGYSVYGMINAQLAERARQACEDAAVNRPAQAALEVCREALEHGAAKPGVLVSLAALQLELEQPEAAAATLDQALTTLSPPQRDQLAVLVSTRACEPYISRHMADPAPAADPEALERRRTLDRVQRALCARLPGLPVSEAYLLQSYKIVFNMLHVSGDVDGVEPLCAEAQARFSAQTLINDASPCAPVAAPPAAP